MNTPSIPIVTSIAPGHFEKQQGAVNSWLSIGFSVVSLNIPEEIAQLAPLYPQITFHPVERDARAIAGKPLVYFDDLLRYFRENQTKTCAIINSDIYLTAQPDFIEFIQQEADNTLIFGSRVDVVENEGKTGEWMGGIYRWGFDLFFFDYHLLQLFPTSPFCLGLPWWDYWPQMIAIQRGIVPKNLATLVAHHYKHSTNYSSDIWLDYGIIFTEYFDKETAQNKLKPLRPDKVKLDLALSDIARQLLKLFREKSQTIHYKTAEKLPKPYQLDNYMSAQQLTHIGCTDEAAQLLNELLTIDPTHARAYNALGFIAFNKGEQQKALHLFEQAIIHDPDNLNFKRNIANFYAMLNKNSEALALFSAIVQKYPEDMDALQKACDLSNRLNDKEKLEYFCKAILNIDPHHAARYYLTKLDQTVIAPKSVKNTEHNKNNTSTVTSPPKISSKKKQKRKK